MAIAIAFLIFCSILLLTAAVVVPMTTRKEVKDRLTQLMPPEDQRHVLVAPKSRWESFLAALGRKVRMKQEELFRYRELLIAAGFGRDSVYVFLGFKLLLALCLPSVYLFLVVLPHKKMGDGRSVLFLVTLAVIGFLLPTFWLRRRVNERKTEIFHTLPDVLDLLTVCVEAGLNLDAAFIKTTENISSKKNPLIEEIELATLEIRAGRPRPEALRGLAARTLVEDLSTFATMLVQSEKFGTSLGRTLRTYSDSLRIKRKQVAEEAAAKTSVKMLLPLVMFIFPALLVVLLVPAFFRIMEIFSKH